MNLVMKWSEIRSVIFTGAGSAFSPGSSSSGGGLTIPNPLHQLPGGTFIPPNIHLGAQSSNPATSTATTVV
jgi:hypothetical protein